MGKVGRFLKKAVGGIGDVAKFAAPLATLIPGVGVPLAAGIGAAGGALGTLNDAKGTNAGRMLKHAFGHGALGAVGGYGVDKLSGGVNGIGGLRAAGGKIGGALFGKPGVPGAPDEFGATMGSPATKGLLDRALGWAGKNPDLVLGGGLAAANMWQNSKQNAQADTFRNQAMQNLQSDRDDRGAFRKAALAQMSQPLPQVDLSRVFADRGNPYG